MEVELRSLGEEGDGLRCSSVVIWWVNWMMVGMVGVVEVAISLASCDMEKKGTGSFKWHIWRRDIQANWMMPAEKTASGSDCFNIW